MVEGMETVDDEDPEELYRKRCPRRNEETRLGDGEGDKTQWGRIGDERIRIDREQHDVRNGINKTR